MKKIEALELSKRVTCLPFTRIVVMNGLMESTVLRSNDEQYRTPRQ